MQALLSNPWYILLVPCMFVLMEMISIGMHKFLQHGSLWVLHEDHHRYTKGRWEKNDVFSFFFSILSILLLITGFFGGLDVRFWLGIGMLCYGFGYFLYHDIVFHKRVKLRYKPKNRYIQRVLNAHRMHHQKSTDHDGVSFGFFFVGKQYNHTT